MSVDNSSYNKGGLIAFLFSFIFSIVFIFVLSFVYKGIDLDEVRAQAKAADEAASSGTEAPSFDSSSVKEAWVSTPDLVSHGKSVYQSNCAACHGSSGKGDGPAGKAIGARDLVEGQWVAGGTSKALFKTVTDGIKGTSMAGFSSIKVIDRWAMVHFIRSITKNKPKNNDEKLKSFAQSAK